MSKQFEQGWYTKAKIIVSPNFNQRPANVDIDLVVMHCVSLPEGQYDNFYVEGLFTNTLNCDLYSNFKNLKDIKVSSHFYIKRDGKILQFVSVNDRAWHAGISSFRGKQDCNDFSVGIELQGTDKSSYTSDQYESLNKLLADLKNSYPTLKDIVGHQDIAPKRKTDPGRQFDWTKVKFL